MTQKLENLNIISATQLVSPQEIKSRFPLSDTAAVLVAKTRQEIREILTGEDNKRILVVVGPCSIHDPKAGLEYARRLKPLADQLAPSIRIIMRTYFEKPRTVLGWKGLINDPHLDDSCDIGTGLETARKLLLEINELGMPCATEMLDPITPQYLADLISWSAIGARTIESQTHREMASGLSMPVGFKNGTDGSLPAALNAITSARHPHSFLGINSDGMTSVVKTRGNPDRHLVLRGGGGRTNYSAEDVAKAAAALQDDRIKRSVMIDCSHDNAQKDHTKQGGVCRSVLEQYQAGQKAIMGLMLESNLLPGKQGWKPGAELQYGLSITDACIGWDETEELLKEIANRAS